MTSDETRPPVLSNSDPDVSAAVPPAPPAVDLNATIDPGASVEAPTVPPAAVDDDDDVELIEDSDDPETEVVAKEKEVAAA